MTHNEKQGNNKNESQALREILEKNLNDVYFEKKTQNYERLLLNKNAKKPAIINWTGYDSNNLENVLMAKEIVNNKGYRFSGLVVEDNLEKYNDMVDKLKVSQNCDDISVKYGTLDDAFKLQLSNSDKFDLVTEKDNMFVKYGNEKINQKRFHSLAVTAGLLLRSESGKFLVYGSDGQEREELMDDYEISDDFMYEIESTTKITADILYLPEMKKSEYNKIYNTLGDNVLCDDTLLITNSVNTGVQNIIEEYSSQKVSFLGKVSYDNGNYEKSAYFIKV